MPSRRSFLGFAAASIALTALPAPGEAKLVALPKPLPPSTPIGKGEFVNAPPAWLRMVKRFPALHPGEATFRRVESTRTREAELNHVHRMVNTQVRFTPEERDIWQPAGNQGDCEDIALRKLDTLVRNFGWPRGALTLATCRIETGQGHAVLLAHTSRGVYALDNRRGPVLPWHALPYRWRAREAPGSPFALWRTIPSA